MGDLMVPSYENRNLGETRERVRELQRWPRLVTWFTRKKELTKLQRESVSHFPLGSEGVGATLIFDRITARVRPTWQPHSPPHGFKASGSSAYSGSLELRHLTV